MPGLGGGAIDASVAHPARIYDYSGAGKRVMHPPGPAQQSRAW